MRRKMRFASLAMDAKMLFNMADRIVWESGVFSIACILNDSYSYVDVFVLKVRIKRFWCVSR